MVGAEMVRGKSRMSTGPTDPARRWNDLCQAWARPDLPPLPTGERLELCRRLFMAEERETKAVIYGVIIVDDVPEGMEFEDLFRRADDGRFRWQAMIDKCIKDERDREDSEMKMSQLYGWLKRQQREGTSDDT